jgi:hypothetical protein
MQACGDRPGDGARSNDLVLDEPPLDWTITSAEIDQLILRLAKNTSRS